ncbi:MAG: hypothetical protein WAL59_25965 [Roseiarcus sp.]
MSQETGRQKSQLSGDDRSDKPEVVMHISIGDEASTNGKTVRSSTDSTKMTTVTFGSVTVTGPAPSEGVVRENIAASRRALEGALDAFKKPGIRLPRRRNVPLYRADPNEPNILIRELNGREERGTMSEGQFIIAK